MVLQTLFVANGYSVCFLRGRLDLHTATYRTLTTREISHPLTKETDTGRRSCLTDYKEDRHEKTKLSHWLQRRQTRKDGVVSLTTKKTDTRRRSCLTDYKEDRHEKTDLSHWLQRRQTREDGLVSLTIKKTDTRRRSCLILYRCRGNRAGNWCRLRRPSCYSTVRNRCTSTCTISWTWLLW